MTTATQPPRLLLVNAGMRVYREYLLRSLATRYAVHLFSSYPVSWELSYLAGHTSVRSTTAADDMLTSALELHSAEPFAGLLCWDEASILAAARVAQALGLPGGDPAVVERCRDKRLTRLTLDEAGVAQPRSVAVSTVDEAVTAATELGGPVVLKPRALGGSLGVVVADDPEQVRERFPFTLGTEVAGVPRADAPVLVEQYVSGPEISVDAVVHQGRVEVMFIAHKELGFAPYCEEVGHRMDGADPLLKDPELLDQLQHIHTALGIRDGATHTEFKLTGSGPVLIEVNGRLGGDLIPQLGQLVTGIDPALAAASVACGRSPELRPDRTLVGSVRFYYPDREGTIGAVRVEENGLPGVVALVMPVAEPGFRVAPPPEGIMEGRLAVAVAVGDDPAGCRASLDAVAARIRTVWA
ncbi:ATP-grasp domain-containing protein [Micromonospora violae]|uniref:ATP-grasp domain-containing protein n=1 Tax=Micromonospora violae TaxID=1278207 RepID=UPI0033D208EA